MNNFHEEIDRLFPVRNSAQQNNAFRAYVKEQFPEAREEEAGGHRNLVLGTPETAEAIFCAHYDTPRRSLFPNLMLPASKGLHLLYTLLILLPCIAVVAVFIVLLKRGPDTLLGLPARFVLLLLYFIVYFGLFFLLFKGPANRHNSNDNTSGTAAVLETARRLNGDKRFAFILFDDEEKGKLGSKAYAAAHPDLRQNTPVVNLDCVGNGGTFVISASEAFLNTPLCASMRVQAGKAGLEAVFLDRKHSKMNSDHLNFTCSAGLCACKKTKKGLLYTPLIHTARDTEVSPENMTRLADLLKNAVNAED